MESVDSFVRFGSSTCAATTRPRYSLQSASGDKCPSSLQSNQMRESGRIGMPVFAVIVVIDKNGSSSLSCTLPNRRRARRSFAGTMQRANARASRSNGSIG